MTTLILVLTMSTLSFIIGRANGIDEGKQQREERANVRNSERSYD